MVSASFGPKNNYVAPVIHIGESLPYKNQSLWIRLDLEEVFEKNENADIFDLFVIRKRPGDQLIVLPFLDRFQARITTKAQKILGQNIEKIQLYPDLFLKTIQGVVYETQNGSAGIYQVYSRRSYCRDSHDGVTQLYLFDSSTGRTLIGKRCETPQYSPDYGR